MPDANEIITSTEAHTRMLDTLKATGLLAERPVFVGDRGSLPRDGGRLSFQAHVRLKGTTPEAAAENFMAIAKATRETHVIDLAGVSVERLDDFTWLPAAVYYPQNGAGRIRPRPWFEAALEPRVRSRCPTVALAKTRQASVRAWLGVLALAGCVGQETASAAESRSEPVALVDAFPAQVGPIASSIEATANLVAERQVTVVAELDGRLIELSVAEGDEVEAGALIGVLDGKSATHAIKAARIKATSASATHGRADKLARQQLLAPEELEKLDNARESAAQDLSTAQWQLARTRVRAPIPGRVTKRHAIAGKWLRTGEAIVDVTDFGVLIARIHVPERDALRLAPERVAEVVLQADDEVRFTGTIRRVAEVVDTKSGTVEIVIEVKGAPPQVRSGSFVSIRVEREREPAAIWLPREALMRESSGAIVFVVEDGVVHRRELELGTEQGPRVAIKSGLRAGELVVLAGQGALRDGEPVQLRPAK